MLFKVKELIEDVIKDSSVEDNTYCVDLSLLAKMKMAFDSAQAEGERLKGNIDGIWREARSGSDASFEVGVAKDNIVCYITELLEVYKCLDALSPKDELSGFTRFGSDSFGAFEFGTEDSNSLSGYSSRDSFPSVDGLGCIDSPFSEDELDTVDSFPSEDELGTKDSFPSADELDIKDSLSNEGETCFSKANCCVDCPQAIACLGKEPSLCGSSYKCER